MSADSKRDYDAAFQRTLEGVDLFLRDLIDAPVVRWRNVELPEIRNPRVDMLGETEAGGLVHIEAQSRNDPTMALRMAEYGLRIYRATSRFPNQIVLYFGEAPMRMPVEFRTPSASFFYQLVDVRRLVTEPLLESWSLDDNTLALLTNVGDGRGAVQRVLHRIIGLPPHEREDVLRRVVILSGLRKKIGSLVEEEARKMPITEDILEHGILGPRIKQGREEGRVEGELAIVTDLIARRFGTSPSWVFERLGALNAEQLRIIAVRILEAKSVNDLFE